MTPSLHSGESKRKRSTDERNKLRLGLGSSDTQKELSIRGWTILSGYNYYLYGSGDRSLTA